jgi:hypothetical protein
MTSRHHWIIDKVVRMIAKIKHDVPYPWNQLARPTAKVNAPKAEVKGQGLNSTKWKGCRGITFFIFKLFTWKVTVLIILKTYKRAVARE